MAIEAGREIKELGAVAVSILSVKSVCTLGLARVSSGFIRDQGCGGEGAARGKGGRGAGANPWARGEPRPEVSGDEAGGGGGGGGVNPMITKLLHRRHLLARS